MEKVKVTKEQADRIESCKTLSEDSHGFTIFMGNAISGWKNHENKCLNELTPEQQASAWINDYEVELTPHEKILEFYKRVSASEKYTLGKHTGISVTLDILGITIEGVNDNG